VGRRRPHRRRYVAAPGPAATRRRRRIRGPLPHARWIVAACLRRWIALLAAATLVAAGALTVFFAESYFVDASAAGSAITRAQIMSRAQNWYADRQRLHRDSSGHDATLVQDPDGDDSYRPDNSGFVSMAWHLVPGKEGGLRTRNLPSVSIEISHAELQGGDVLLDTADGHVVLFAGWEADRSHFSYYSFGKKGLEFVTGASFSAARIAGLPTENYRSYRYRNVLGQNATTSDSTVGSLADVNGDGKVDLVTRDTSGVLWLYPSTGKATHDGVVGKAVRIGNGWNDRTVLTGDLTGDGKADIVSRDSSGTLRLHRSTGKVADGKVVSAPVRIGAKWNGVALGLADVTADGKADIVSRDSSGTLRLYRSTGKVADDKVVSAPVVLGTGWNDLTLF